jgi:uncharacterized repeat protein (TIGR01451 family)
LRRPTLLVAILAAALIPSRSFGASFAYVTDQTYNAVAVYRTTDWLLTNVIPVGHSPAAIAMPAAGGFAYVTNRNSDTVSRIELATGTVSATFPVPGGPTSLAINSDGTRAYVVQPTNCPSSLPPPPGPPPCTVAAIDPASNSIIATIPVGHEPVAVALSHDGARAYVTDRTDATLSVIDTVTNTVVGTIPAGVTPEAVAVGAGEIYVTNDTPATVLVFDESDLHFIGTLPSGISPAGVVVSPDGTTAVITNGGEASVSLVSIDTHTVTSGALVGPGPAAVAVLGDSSAAVVANSGGTSLSIVDLGTQAVLTVPVAGAPSGVAITPEPKLRLTKLASIDPVVPGQSVTYSLTYANVGSGPARNVTLSDPIVAHLTFASATGGGVPVGGSVRWSIPVIPPGGSATVDATFTVQSPVADQTVITNTATIADASGHSALAQADVTVNQRPSFGLALTGAPNPVAAGSTLTYTVTYSNMETAVAHGVHLDLTADPDRLAFVTANPAPDFGSTTRWTIGDLPVGGSGTITVTMAVAAPLADGTLLQAQALLSDDAANHREATASNTVRSAAGLALSASDSPDPVTAGQTILYDFTYGNNAGASAQGVVLTLSYDPNVTYEASNLPPDSGTTNRWTLGTLGGGVSSSLVVRTRVASVVANGNVIHTTAHLSDVNGGAASSGAHTTALSQPVLSLAKTDLPDPVRSGDQLSYVLTYGNTGSDIAAGVVVTETYPSQVSFVSSTPPPDPGTDNQWTIGTVAAGASGSINIVTSVTGPNDTVADNTAVVSDSAGHSAAATASTIIALLPRLTLGMSDGPDPVAPGGLITYTLAYGNSGTNNATGVVLTTSFPAATSFVSAVPAPDPGTTDHWTLGTLPPGASGTVSVRVAVDRSTVNGSALVAQATIQDDASRLASASTATSVRSSSAIALAAAASPEPASAAGQIVYTVSFGNRSSSPVAGLLLTEAYDPRLTFVSASVPPDFGTDNTWTLGSLGPGTGTSIRITLQVSGSVADGSVLASEAKLTAAGGELAQAAEVSTVGTSPLELALTGAPNPMGSGGVVDYALTYRNLSAAPINGVTLTFVPEPPSLFVSSTPPPQSPTTLVWNVGTIPPNTGGTIGIRVLGTPPPGAILAARASATNASLNVATAAYVAVAGRDSITIRQAGITRVPTARQPRDNFLFRTFITLPSPFDGTQDSAFSISTGDQVLVGLPVPASLLRLASVGVWRYRVTSPVPGGGKFRFALERGGGGYHLRVSGRNMTLPAPSGLDIRTSFAVGSDSVTTVKRFRQLQSRPGGRQVLKYP